VAAGGGGRRGEEKRGEERRGEEEVGEITVIYNQQRGSVSGS